MLTLICLHIVTLTLLFKRYLNRRKPMKHMYTLDHACFFFLISQNYQYFESYKNVVDCTYLQPISHSNFPWPLIFPS